MSLLSCIYVMFVEIFGLQNELRTSGCLAYVLSNCGTVFESPLSREWALFCIKSACEGNEENQKFIDSLKPQGVIQDEILKAHGITVEMNQDGRGISFRQDVS